MNTDPAPRYRPFCITRFICGVAPAIYADLRTGTKRISTRRFKTPAILRNIASEWPP